MSDLHLRQARILIVDDQEPNLLLLEDILHQAGFTNLLSETDPQKVFDHYQTFQPDLILLDLLMPYMDGFRVMELLREIVPPDTYLPILVLTADITREAKRRALSNGARDFLLKPIDAMEVILRIQNLLETRYLHRELTTHNQRLQEEVRVRTHELEQSRVEMLQRLASAVEYRDDEMGEHTRRVGENAGRIAQVLGFKAEEVELIRLAAPLHDLGKIGISDSILLKPGPLTATEFTLMKTHTTIGGALLSNGRSQLVQIAEQIALTHHERWDGTGYPYGLRGEEIPLVGRVVAVADVFDALTHERPYKPAWSVDDAFAEMMRTTSTHFDPRVMAAFQSITPVL